MAKYQKQAPHQLNNPFQMDDMVKKAHHDATLHKWKTHLQFSCIKTLNPLYQLATSTWQFDLTGMTNMGS